MSINIRRAHYFKNRSSRANRPPYSGFETLVFISTGVVRNLLEPCYWMFDSAVSKAKETRCEEGSETISNIPSNIQAEVIQRLSERKWEWVRNNISQGIEDCSTGDGLRAFQLLDALAVHFRYRLQHHQSEPCALSFTISKCEPDVMVNLKHLIEILRKAQLLYIRSGPSKDSGQIEPYYVPNKILCRSAPRSTRSACKSLDTGRRSLEGG